MKLKLVAALLGLAIGGCAQSRSMRLPEGPDSKPIGVDPVPSIHETINRGTNPAVARSALSDPANPQWSGQSQPEQPPATGPAPRVATTEPPANFQARPEPAAAPPTNSPSPLPNLEPEVAATPRPAGGAPSPGPSTDPQFGDVRNHAEPPGLDPGLAATPRPALGDPTISPSSDARVDDAHDLDDALPPIMEADDDASLPPVTEADEPLEPTAPPASAAQPGSAAAPMEEDPLLGPNPELMPAMDDLVPSREAAAAKADDEPAPASSAEPEPKPAAQDLDLDLDLESDAPTKADEPKPAPAAEAAPAPTPVPELDLDLEPGSPADSAEAPALPDLTPAPIPNEGAELPELPPAAEPSAGMFPANQQSQALAARSPAPRVDPAVRRVSTAAAPSSPSPADHVADDPNLIEAGRTAARVGDEVITLRELVVAVKDQVARHGGKIGQIPADELNMIAQTILAGLIERSLIVQEAKRQLKDKKQMDRIHEAADKYWREEGLPPLLRQYMVENEYQLKEKISESGRSLEALRQNYIQDFIVQIFVHQKLSDKMKVELPEMLKYYNEHINDKENQRRAQIVWRELLVEVGRHPSPADARRKADELLARLKAGEDFAKLAIAESEGPALIKSQGGLMKTAPGSYAVAAVNQAIETLPPGEISGIIEGPSSLHIVRVESRRAAGPATFAELQDQIRQRLTMEKMNREREALLTKLRSNTIVTTIFDGTASDPNRALNH